MRTPQRLQISKQKAGVVISIFEEQDVEWGMITSTTLEERLHAVQSGKKLRQIIQQYFTILFPPCMTPALATRSRRRHLEEITTSTRDEAINNHPAASPPKWRSLPLQATLTSKAKAWQKTQAGRSRLRSSSNGCGQTRDSHGTPCAGREL